MQNFCVLHRLFRNLAAVLAFGHRCVRESALPLVTYTHWKVAIMDPQLIDEIYEASFVPELWPIVLDELAQIAGARGGLLFTANTEVSNWTSSASLREAFEIYVHDRWLMRGLRRDRLFGARHAGFLVDYDLATEEELEVDPLYRDFLRPRSLGWASGTGVSLPTGDMLIISLEREYIRGPIERAVVEQLDQLRPHLCRSALLSARLQMERARIASETLAAIGLPALVLEERGKVLATNHLMDGLTSYVHWRAQDRVSLKDQAADQLLREAIAAIGAAGGSVRSFPVRDAETQAVAHVIPIRLSARDIFVRCSAVLVLTPVTLPQAPPVELVQSLFDLTPTEARVARDLASGETVEAIASTKGVSQNTIRAHVRGISGKNWLQPPG